MNPQELRDIRGPVTLPGDWWWLWLLAGMVLAVVMVWAAIGAWRYFKRSAPLPAPVPAWDKALAELDRLASAPVGTEAEIKQFYFLLSGIIRLYIEERFNIRAPEMTTEEFMERVRVSPDLSASQRDFLGQFLNISDMVKFARHEPTASDRAEAMAFARRFVQGTRVMSGEGAA